MFIRKRSIIKYLILIPLIWILVAFIFGFNDSESQRTKIDNDMINKMIEKAKEKHLQHDHAKPLIEKSESENIKNEQKAAVHDDHDHPDEERKKADEQQKEAAGKVQINAPKEPHNDPNAPGELGKPVIIDKEKLSPEERKKYDEGWKNNAFNQYVSDMISLHRSLADIRDPA